MSSPRKLPTQAIALAYDGKKAPKVVAKGNREIAEKIIEIAKKNGVHLHQDIELTRLLMNLDLGEEIPQALYISIAKVIAFAYSLDKKKKRKRKKL